MNRLLSYLNETFDGLRRRGAQADSRPYRAAVQSHPAGAVAGGIRPGLQPGARIPTGNLRYLDFMAPGILAQSILFSAIFYGIAIIWERDLGIVHKLLVTPAHRSALIMGKAFAAGLRGLVQAAVVYLVAIALHVEIRWELMPILTVAAGVFVGSCIFSTFPWSSPASSKPGSASWASAKS